MIKAIIFDLGGVVIKHRSNLMPYIISTVFDLNLEDGRVIWHKYKNALLTGELPSVAFLQKIKEETQNEFSVDVLLRRWVDLYEREARDLNVSLLDRIRRLREKYAVYLLTDTFDAHHAFNDSRGLYQNFDGVYCSHMEKRAKSQGKDVFTHFLEKFHLQASECVFIDDMDAYVAMAKSLGIRGIVYTTNDKLTLALKLMGVNL